MDKIGASRARYAYDLRQAPLANRKGIRQGKPVPIMVCDFHMLVVLSSLRCDYGDLEGVDSTTSSKHGVKRLKSIFLPHGCSVFALVKHPGDVLCWDVSARIRQTLNQSTSCCQYEKMFRCMGHHRLVRSEVCRNIGLNCHYGHVVNRETICL